MIRTTELVLPAHRTVEGAGFVVHRPFPAAELSHFDPFLLLDEMGPVDLSPGEAVGAPDHPHRGFETVTYVLAGGVEHRDSAGHAGRLGPGDVQWMTAGAGIVHSELPSRELLRDGGRSHGFQLWVNLPRRDKMMRPRYQEIPGARVPRAASRDGRVRVRVIAGEALGARAVIDTRTPILYLHFSIDPGGDVVQPVPAAWAAFAYVFEGEGVFGRDRRAAGAHRAVLFAGDGDEVSLANPGGGGRPLEALLVAGAPLGEPVVQYGPFVMNSPEEIVQAMVDYQRGAMGSIAAEIVDEGGATDGE